MTTGRDKFVRDLALMASGLGAMPQQVDAFERLFSANTPVGRRSLICMDEAMFCGTATKSLRVVIEIFADGELKHTWAVNTFGGTIRWVATMTQMIVAENVAWKIHSLEKDITDAEAFAAMTAEISYIDMALVRHTHLLKRPAGSIR